MSRQKTNAAFICHMHFVPWCHTNFIIKARGTCSEWAFNRRSTCQLETLRHVNAAAVRERERERERERARLFAVAPAAAVTEIWKKRNMPSHLYTTQFVVALS